MTPAWIVRRAAARARRAPFFVVLLTAVFAVVAALAAAAVALAQQSERASARLAEQTHVVAYLDAALPKGQAAALVVAFGRLGGVAAAREVDSASALAELQSTMRSGGAAPEALTDIEADLLPRSIEITLAPGGDLPGRAREVADRLRRLPGVSAVDAMADGLARVASVGLLAGQLSTLFSAVAALAALALLGGLVVRERGQHREMAETMHLLGAPTLSMWLPLGLGDAVAALVGGMAGWHLGGWLTTRVLQAPADLASVAGPGLLWGMLFLCAVGLLTGRLSLPRPRGMVRP